MAGDITLEMKDIKKHFAGVKALRGVDLTVREGEVHALIGENGAGKSTLMKVLMGYYRPDEGQILYGGSPVQFASTMDAIQCGISMIFQEFNAAPDMTVAENIYLNREPKTRFKTVDYKRMQEDARALFERLKVKINPAQRIRELTTAEMQLVEIVKALSFNSRVIIMDEPTSALSNKEIDNLFRIIGDMRAEGKSIIYISHKLEEIYRICDYATVMRDGLVTGCGEVEGLDQEQLIMLMVNRNVKELYPKVVAKKGDVLLKVEGLSHKGAFSDVSFELRAGEILGFCGLMGAGRTEIVETIVGVRKADSGEVYVRGEKVKIKHPEDAFRNGIGMVPEDRKLNGAILKLPISENIVMSKLRRIMRHSIISAKKESALVEEYFKMLQIKAASEKQPVESLSGGNQQKVVLSRVLFTEPDILLFDEPTRGIDVLTKSEIYLLSSKLAKEGKAILMVSSEMPELIGMCDRIIVLHEGRITGEVEKQDFDQHDIMKLAMGL